jgi:hypothetical protein
MGGKVERGIAVEAIVGQVAGVTIRHGHITQHAPLLVAVEIVGVQAE